MSVDISGSMKAWERQGMEGPGSQSTGAFGSRENFGEVCGAGPTDCAQCT